MEPLSFGTGAVATVNVHPVVLMSALDQHVRQTGKPGRVIGFLLGTSSGTTVEVTNSCGLSYTVAGKDVSIPDPTDIIKMLKLVNPLEQVVGWYSTLAAGEEGSPISKFTAVVHQFCEGFCSRQPIHLLIDASLTTDRIKIAAYVPNPNPVLKSLMVPFAPLKVAVVASHEARVGVDAILKATAGASGELSPSAAASAGTMDSEVVSLETSMRRLLSLLDSTLAYVDAVVAGSKGGDEAIGRQIADTLAAVPPTLDPAAFDKQFASAVQDLLMVSYLAQMTTAHMRVAERLQLLPARGDGGRAPGGGGGR